MKRAVVALLAALSSTAFADDDVLVALVPGRPGAAHHATPLAIGPHGEVYAPDAAGRWVRTEPVTTATAITVAIRGDDAVYAGGGGVVYRLADNGWTAVRVVQHGAALLARGAGGHPVAVVDKQVLALDRAAAGEPVKLAAAPGSITAAAFGAVAVVVTAAGVAQLRGTRFAPVRVPRVAKLVSDRWAVTDDGAYAIATGARTAWPFDRFPLSIASALPGGGLAVVGADHDAPPGRRYAAVLAGRKWKLTALGVPPSGSGAVGVTLDAAGHVIVAFANGDITIGDAPPVHVTP